MNQIILLKSCLTYTAGTLSAKPSVFIHVVESFILSHETFHSMIFYTQCENGWQKRASLSFIEELNTTCRFHQWKGEKKQTADSPFKGLLPENLSHCFIHPSVILSVKLEKKSAQQITSCIISFIISFEVWMNLLSLNNQNIQTGNSPPSPTPKSGWDHIWSCLLISFYKGLFHPSFFPSQ